MRWEKGRQKGADYNKLKIFSGRIFNYGLDCYVLKYDKFTSLPEHTDKVNGGRHYRLNLNIKGKSRFSCEKCIIKSRFVNLFRADLYRHSLFTETDTTKLSIGFVNFNKDLTK